MMPIQAISPNYSSDIFGQKKMFKKLFEGKMLKRSQQTNLKIILPIYAEFFGYSNFLFQDIQKTLLTGRNPQRSILGS